MMNGNTLIACVCKPYTIQLDGKPFKVDGEQLVGFFLEPVGKANPFEMKKGGSYLNRSFFKAAVFTEQKNGFEIDGTVILSMKEFLERVKDWSPVLVPAF